MIEIYTDGSAKANGKADSIGGFGVVVMEENRIVYTYKENNIKGATNNQMELKALLKALSLSQSRAFKDKKCVIYSDSSYCVNIMREWIYSWAKNNWTRANNKKIENLDLILNLYEYIKIDFPNFNIKKISGHNNIFGNELADALATNNESKINNLTNEKMISLCDF